MDKISGPGLSQPFLPRKDDAKKGRKASESSKTGFLGFLKRTDAAEAETSGAGAVSGTAGEAQIETLLDEVYASGQDLARNPSPENVVAYKKAVARFIRQVVDGSVEMTETEGRMRKDMKKPKYALLHVVDDKLEKLGAYVLSNQRDKLEILHKVDELHGLLVDLRH
jgi:uncharacterized protein YaaR (DUF327 family)